MAIVGLGTDIVEIRRIEQSLARTPRLSERILTEVEREFFALHRQPARYLAKRFAAKEAAAKALGTGIAKGVSFLDFTVSNDVLGRPVLTLSGAALARAEQLQVSAIWLSLTDEQAYASATVILEK